MMKKLLLILAALLAAGLLTSGVLAETKEENPPGWRCGSVETCRNGTKCLCPEAASCGGRAVTAK